MCVLIIIPQIMTLWTFVGFSLAFGEDANGVGLIGNPATYLFLRNVSVLNLHLVRLVTCSHVRVKKQIARKTYNCCATHVAHRLFLPLLSPGRRQT